MNVATLSKSFLLDSRFAIFGQTSVRKYWMENVRSVRRIWRNIGHQRHRTFRPSNAFFELQKFTHFRFGINFLGMNSNNFLYSCEFWILFQDKRLIPMMVFLPKFPYLLSLHFWWIRSHLKLSSVKSSNSDDLPKIPIVKNLTVFDFEFVKTRLESKFSNGHFVITSILQCWIENIKSDDDVTWIGLCTAISQFYTLILSSTTKWFWTMKPADFIEQWTEKSLQFLICYRLHKMSGKKTGNFDDWKIVNRSLFWIFWIVTRSFNIPIH